MQAVSAQELLVQSATEQAQKTIEERKKFLEERKSGLGGTDAGAVCGLSRWKSPMDIYLEKTGVVEDITPSEAMIWGTIQEEIIARHYANVTGRKLRRPTGCFRHKDYPWMIAHLDRIILNENRGLEVKTSSQFMADEWGESGTDEVPEYYRAQVMHYMAIKGYPSMDLAVLIGGNDFRIYTIERDLTYIANLVELERDFWQEHVLSRIPPDVDASKACSNALAKLYDRPEGIEVLATPEIDEIAQRLRQVKALMKQNEEDKRLLENSIKKFMGNAEKLIGADWHITWKVGSRRQFDVKAFRAAEPELAEQYTNVTETRTFRPNFSKKEGEKRN